jgi:hypothetical protein
MNPCGLASIVVVSKPSQNSAKHGIKSRSGFGTVRPAAKQVSPLFAVVSKSMEEGLLLDFVEIGARGSDLNLFCGCVEYRLRDVVGSIRQSLEDGIQCHHLGRIVEVGIDDK